MIRILILILATWPLTLATLALDLPEPQNKPDAHTEAVALEARGELSQARELWLALAPQLAIGEAREAALARGRSLTARLALREEIVAAVPNDQRVFAELGIDKADAAGITAADKRTPWHEVSLDTLSRAATAARVSISAANGLVFESLARGSPAARRTALTDLGRRFERKEIDARDAFAAVARARDEKIPASGYVFRAGVWSALDVAVEGERIVALEEAGRKLENSVPTQRAAALEHLNTLGPEAIPRLQAALDARFAAAAAAIANPSWQKPLLAVVEARRTLDESRRAALSLIFDEERYFYPYTPPDCPQEKVKLYAGVQQEVDGLVGRLREAWKFSRRATVPANVRVALEELDWNRAMRAQHKLAPADMQSLPPWVDGLDRGAEVVMLQQFAWDAKERAALQRNDQIDAFNVRSFERKEPDDARRADREEQKQVAVTNEYRRLFGLNALAWNPKLQVAAQGHSDYMSLTGDFGHYEKDLERKTPGDRLKLAGYTSAGGENCSLGQPSAEGAHQGWTHSSGHHRNILTATHREMASALAAIYWTQNFGAGREFESDLVPLKD